MYNSYRHFSFLGKGRFQLNRIAPKSEFLCALSALYILLIININSYYKLWIYDTILTAAIKIFNKNLLKNKYL